ncbi:hypothetical protein ACOME3_010745 [Neoechinorhynchus agilis]
MHKTARSCSSSDANRSAVQKVNDLFADNGYSSKEIKQLQMRSERVNQHGSDAIRRAQAGTRKENEEKCLFVAVATPFMKSRVNDARQMSIESFFNIGKTERPLYKRVTGHVRNALNLNAPSYQTTPWAEHYLRGHPDGEIQLSTDIGYISQDPVDLAITEELLISLVRRKG